MKSAKVLLDLGALITYSNHYALPQTHRADHTRNLGDPTQVWEFGVRVWVTALRAQDVSLNQSTGH